ncbi:MAG: chemotaxis protein CheW [Verrucomicrobiaceae bacterium]|nr:chemotaxis protein CheW [Verrucomicrobiaceae bacterium]
MINMLQTQPTVTQIATLLIPVSGKHLVLPNVNVAEIIPYIPPFTEEDVPNWFLGCFIWRNTRVPLISFEAINDEPFAAQGGNRRIAILNSVIGDPRLPFCGIVTEGLPRLMRLLPEEIAEDAENAPGPAEIARVLVNGERASIPNVAFIQHEAKQLI